MAPILTITIPCYNVERYLERSLDSYCDKRLEGLVQVIIVNDGSTDSTRQIAESYVSKWPGIFTLVNQKNGGHGAGINTGLEHAEGKYFRVVDGDDWINADALLEVLQFMKLQTVDFVCDVKQEVHMVTGEKTLFPFPAGIPCWQELDFVNVCKMGLAEPYLMIHNLSFRTEYLRSIHLRLLRHTFYEDWEYVVKGCAPAKTCAFIDENVYQYLVGNANQSVSAANYATRWDHHTRVLETMLSWRNERKTANDISAESQSYLEQKLALLIDTHYNIALIYDEDRKRGLSRAKQFRAWLKANYPEFSKRADKRYHTALALHFAGVDATKLDKLMHRNARH